jgi:hypothetical protein
MTLKRKALARAAAVALSLPRAIAGGADGVAEGGVEGLHVMVQDVGERGKHTSKGSGKHLVKIPMCLFKSLPNDISLILLKMIKQFSSILMPLS